MAETLEQELASLRDSLVEAKIVRDSRVAEGRFARNVATFLAALLPRYTTPTTTAFILSVIHHHANAMDAHASLDYLIAHDEEQIAEVEKRISAGETVWVNR